MTAANDNTRGSEGNPERSARPCPICGRPARPEATPFCSKRCADVDLHRWLGGRYAVPGEALDDAEDER